MDGSDGQAKDAKEYLFVYGTLLPGHAPPAIAPITRHLRQLGRGRARGYLYDLGNFPGAVLTETAATIQGVIFELPVEPSLLKRLDEYEGFNPDRPETSQFVRCQWPVILRTGRILTCWVYAYNRNPGSAQRITNGDFVAWKQSRKSASV